MHLLLTRNDTLNQISTILAFDIGLKRIGVASGQSLTKSANPAGQLSVAQGKIDFTSLDKLITEWQPKVIVVGNPFNEELYKPDPHLKKAINRFKHHIQQHHKLKIVDVDERLSSEAANEELSNKGLSQSRKTELRDQIAACLILETYFNSIE